MLSEIINAEIPANARAYGGEFKPFAKASESRWWEEIDAESVGRLVEAGEKYSGKTWPVLTATSYMAKITKDDNSYPNMSGERRTALIALTLFGSVACGDYTADSDIDVMLVLNMDEEEIRTTRSLSLAFYFTIEQSIYRGF